MTAQDVIRMIQEKEVRFVDFRFTDIRGQEQHVGVPAHSWSAVKLDLYGLKFFTQHGGSRGDAPRAVLYSLSGFGIIRRVIGE